MTLGLKICNVVKAVLTALPEDLVSRIACAKGIDCKCIYFRQLAGVFRA